MVFLCDLYMPEITMLHLTNSLIGKKELFKPLADTVKMYVCGVTPYDHAHVGHGRCYIAFDVLLRMLRYLGYHVKYYRNFTDIDDKLINRAAREIGDRLRYKEIANRYISSFEKDMQALNCIVPDGQPRVTDNIKHIIAFIQGLIDQGYAYQANGDVYFQISTFSSYGKLSKHKVEDLRTGLRIDVREQKKDPLDFALWKSESNGEFFKSPWGYGRPGWHIECSVLAKEYLGEQIDIHGGGLDLIFPHHENEIAQSEALHGKNFAQFWIHNGLVNIGKEKMSKSLGNVFSLHELFQQYDPMVVRYYFISHHYRAPIEFSFDGLEAAKKAYQKLIHVFSQHECKKIFGGSIASPIIDRMKEFLLDDLNTPGMLGIVFEHLSDLKNNEQELCAVKQILTDVFGLTLQPLPEKKVTITPEIQKLINERNEARKQKDWVRADAIRDKLKELGVEVYDEKI